MMQININDRPYDAGMEARTTLQREFEGHFTRSHRRAYNLAYRLLGNASEAEDVTQDAFVRAWRHFDQYDRSRPFEGWLFRIVSNLVVDHRRRNGRAQIISLDAPISMDSDGSPLHIDPVDIGSNPEAMLMKDIFSEPVEAALHALPHDYRVAVLLADVEERSYQEIAEIVGVPVGTIRSRIHRGRLMLRRSLERVVGASWNLRRAAAGAN
jgi:RNA polymerase sigma-70 factor, ECF subfamily